MTRSALSRRMLLTALVVLAAPAAFGQGFVDVTQEVGIDYLQWRRGLGVNSEEANMTGGVAAGDFDNDG